MGLFEKKECVLCGAKAGLFSREKIAGGAFICGDCRKKISPYTTGFSRMTLEDVKEQIRIKEENDRRYQSEFVTSRRFDFDSRHPIMAVDDTHGAFAILTNERPDIFTFSQIVSYNVDLSVSKLSDKEREEAEAQGQNSGLLGVLNFIFSDEVGLRYPDMPRCPSGHKVTGMHFVIEFGPNPFNAEKTRINMMPGWSNAADQLDKAYRCANDIYQCIKEYKRNGGGGGAWNAAQGSGAAARTQGLSAAAQLKEWKELLDANVISQSEFDAKKREILGR